MGLWTGEEWTGIFAHHIVWRVPENAVNQRSTSEVLAMQACILGLTKVPMLRYDIGLARVDLVLIHKDMLAAEEEGQRQ